MYFVLDREVLAEKERFVEWTANGQILVHSPLPSMNSWTQHMHYYYPIFLTDLFVNLIAYFTMSFCFSSLSVAVLCGGLNWLKINKIKYFSPQMIKSAYAETT